MEIKDGDLVGCEVDNCELNRSCVRNDEAGVNCSGKDV
ncbi:uncharacterized protein G2W53_009090 [Senna tora]|uniref:Uncharacterized protein n=1 Tax=Senna tora TaxID=362788 RepID=A0A834WXB7_9FABA|nr:uncharacterized protein G2W53_009090 [Senna tora]